MNPQSDCHRWGSELLGQTFDSKNPYPILILPPGNLYRSNRSSYARIPNPPKNGDTTCTLSCVFSQSRPQTQHTLQKKTKSANAKLLRMDLLQWLWLFCEFLAKLQSCYQRHLTVFQRWVHGPIEVMKEATMLNGGQGTKGIFRYNNKNEYKQFASETLGLEDEFPFVKASCQVLCWFQWG